MSAKAVAKWVVIGDGFVGKTCFLITATTNAFPGEYFATVLGNYTHTIQLRDGRQVTVSFSDTSGGEEYSRIRHLSYPKTDTFLVCFSVDSHPSFENVIRTWIPEITHYCPRTPWLLVGLKSDLRTSSQQHQVQSLHHRMVKRNEAVQLAKYLGAVNYFECSSLEGTGLDNIVQTAISIALTKPTRRMFNWPWKSKNPKAGELLPSEPPPNANTLEIAVPSSTLQSQWLKMVDNEHLSDVQFYYETDCYYGHKVVLCAASELFRQIFEIGRELEGEESLSQCNTWSKKRLNVISRQSINNGAFSSIYRGVITVITVNDEQVTKLSFERCLSFLYTGCADVKNDDDLDDTIAAAELLNLPELIRMCNNIKYDLELFNSDVEKHLRDHNSEMMRKLFLNKTLYSDITFVVSGQKIPAHRCVLTARCEVMSTMCSGQFAESKSKTGEIEIPGADLKTFMAFLQYLYTDHCPIEDGEATMILAMADQYCVNRLKALCELHIGEMVEKTSEESVAKLNVVDLLHCAQLHNANQLSGFLLQFMANNFEAFETTKEFQKLTGENLSYVKEHRWPPLSYINAMEEWKDEYGVAKNRKCSIM